MAPEIPRKPLTARLPERPIERRQNRLTPPSCPDCQQDGARATLRTDYVIYFRCETCGTVWSVPKPATQAFGT